MRAYSVRCPMLSIIGSQFSSNKQAIVYSAPKAHMQREPDTKFSFIVV